MPTKPGECLACDLADGRLPLPGGLIYETEHWRVEHCTGPLGVGTLIAKPKRHVLRVGALKPGEYREMGPLLHHTARAVQDLTEPLQVYVCLWSHGPVEAAISDLHAEEPQPVEHRLRQVERFELARPQLQMAVVSSTNSRSYSPRRVITGA